jgi:hypothetical protein
MSFLDDFGSWVGGLFTGGEGGDAGSALGDAANSYYDSGGDAVAGSIGSGASSLASGLGDLADGMGTSPSIDSILARLGSGSQAAATGVGSGGTSPSIDSLMRSSGIDNGSGFSGSPVAGVQNVTASIGRSAGAAGAQANNADSWLQKLMHGDPGANRQAQMALQGIGLIGSLIHHSQPSASQLRSQLASPFNKFTPGQQATFNAWAYAPPKVYVPPVYGHKRGGSVGGLSCLNYADGGTIPGATPGPQSMAMAPGAQGGPMQAGSGMLGRPSVPPMGGPQTMGMAPGAMGGPQTMGLNPGASSGAMMGPQSMPMQGGPQGMPPMGGGGNPMLQQFAQSHPNFNLGVPHPNFAQNHPNWMANNYPSAGVGGGGGINPGAGATPGGGQFPQQGLGGGGLGVLGPGRAMMGGQPQTGGGINPGATGGAQTGFNGGINPGGGMAGPGGGSGPIMSGGGTNPNPMPGQMHSFAMPTNGMQQPGAAYAEGGMVDPSQGGPFTGYVQGDQPGQSDLVPIRVSPGEYVFDADSVAALGDGNNAAGAALLDRMREKLREAKRAAPANDIPPPLALLAQQRGGQQGGPQGMN